jgi:hypothetical protein
MTYGDKGCDGNGIHMTQLRVSAAMLNAGYSIEVIVKRVMHATREAAGREGRGWNWSAEEEALKKMCEDWLAKKTVNVISEAEYRRGHYDD